VFYQPLQTYVKRAFLTIAPIFSSAQQRWWNEYPKAEAKGVEK
jgi:hypothetical protein